MLSIEPLDSMQLKLLFSARAPITLPEPHCQRNAQERSSGELKVQSSMADVICWSCEKRVSGMLDRVQEVLPEAQGG